MEIAVEPPDIQRQRRQLHSARRGQYALAWPPVKNGAATPSITSVEAAEERPLRIDFEFCENVDWAAKQASAESLVKEAGR